MNRHNWVRTLGTAVFLALFLAGPAAVPQVGAQKSPVLDLGGGTALAQSSGTNNGPDRAVSVLTWNVETVDRAKAFRSMEDHSLALDTNGYPHIAYGDDDLFYAWYDGTNWHYETVDTSNDVGEHAALALDNSGKPHISYYDRWGGSLRYAHYDGKDWQIQVVDSGVGSC